MGSSYERWLNENRQQPQAPEAPGTQKTSYDAWAQGASANGRLRTAAQLSDPTKPDQAAQVRFLQEKTGLAPDLIGRNLDEVKRRAMLSDFDPDQFAQQFPETSKWLSEQPEHVSVGLSDMSRLTNIERITKSMKMGFRQGREESESGDINYKELEGQYLNEHDRNRLTAIQRDVEQQPGGLGFWSNLVYKSSKLIGQLGYSANDVVGGASVGLLAAGVVSAIQPEVGIPALLAMGATAGATAGLATSSYRTLAGSAYVNLKSIRGKNGEGIDEGTAQLIASGVGAFGAGLMVGGGGVATQPFAAAGRRLMGEAVKDALVRPTMQAALRDLGVSYAKAMGSGVGIMTLQELGNVTSEEMAKMSSDGDFETVLNSPAQREKAVKRLAKAAKEAVEAMALTAAPGALLHGSTSAWAARRAERNMNYYKALGENLENSETFKRLPSQVQRLVEAQTRGTPIENVYIPAEVWNEYWQKKNQDPSAIANQVLGESDSWREATESGGDLQIPTAKYAAKLAATEHNKFFAQELRASPLAMSFKEAAELVKEEAKQRAPKKEENALEASAEKVKLDITEQLKKAGYDQDTAETYAELYKRAFARFAEKTGRTPEELFTERPITVTRPEEGATTRTGAHRLLEQQALNLDKRMEELRRSPDFQTKVDAFPEMFKGMPEVRTPEEFEKASEEQLNNARTSLERGLWVAGLDGSALHNLLLGLDDLSHMAGEKEAIPTWERRVAEAVEYLSNKKGKEQPSWMAEHIERMVVALRRVEVEQAMRKIGPLSGEFDQSARTFNQDLPPGFFSKAERLIEEKMPNRATVEDVRNILKDVKAEERKWLGLDKMLNTLEADEKVTGMKATKEYVSALLRANRLNIKEAIPERGGTDEHAVNEAYQQEIEDRVDEILSYVNFEVEDGHIQLTFDEGDDPGLEYAKTIVESQSGVFTEDEGTGAVNRHLRGLLNQAVEEVEGEGILDELMENPDMVMDAQGDSGRYEQYTLPGGENYREILFTLPDIGHNPGYVTHDMFMGGHFDELNVFAHARLKDRVIGAPGEKAERVLFVEEIQSDWHQQGREKGYREGKLPGEVKYSEEKKEWYYQEPGMTFPVYLRVTDPAERGRAEQEASHWAAGGQPTDYTYKGAVADAPFRNTWHEFVLKRLIREAAEKGYDAIAWTTGDQQNERYSLEKTVDELRVFDPDEETKPPEERHVHLEGYKRADAAYGWGPNAGSHRIFQETIPLSRLGDYVGKELAVKLMSQERGTAPAEDARKFLESKLNEVIPRVPAWKDMTADELIKFIEDNGGPGDWGRIDPTLQMAAQEYYFAIRQNGWRTLKGEDLRIGGSGMRGFYDDILPRFANQFGKKYKAKVEDMKINLISTDEDIQEIAGGGIGSGLMEMVEESGEGQNYQMRLKTHGLRLTPELKKAALANEFPLFQGERGRILLGEHGIDIELLKQADPSTFIHETGHLFLDMLHRLRDSSPEIKEDYQTIREWMGSQGHDEFTVDQHEMFARAFEKYLAEGRAPAAPLQRAFQRFKTWLLSVYQSLTELNVNLTDDVRHVFDRMLASKEEVEAEGGRNHPLFRDMKAAGIKGDEARSYTEAIERSKLAAEEQMTASIVSAWQKEQSQLFRAERAQHEPQVRAEIQDNPVLRARSRMAEGEMRLHEGTVVGRWGEDNAQRLKEMKLTTPDFTESVSAEVASDAYGFSSSEELVQKLLSSEDPEHYVKRRLDAIMRGRQRQQRPLTAAELPSEALKAVHNEKRAQLLRKEMEILSKMELPKVKGMLRRLVRRIPLIEDVRKQAQILVAGRTVQGLNSHQFAIAEQRAGKMAIELFEKGDIQGALEQKQRELLNHELFRAAAKAQEYVEKSSDYMRRFDRKEVRQRLGLAGGPYLDAIDDLRERFDFTDLTNKDLNKRVSLRDLIDEAAKAGRELDIPDFVKNEAVRKNYKELKISELQGVVDTARQIEKLSRTKNKLLAIRWAKNYGELKTGITDGIYKFFKKDIDRHRNDPLDYTPGILERTKHRLNQIDAGHTKLEFLFKYLDGHKANGPAWRSFFKPLQEAENAENIRFRRAQDALETIFAGSYSRFERAGFFWKKYQVKELGTSLTKGNLLAIALNQGNEYNKAALIEGHEKFRWSEAGIQAALDHLDKRDWDVVQKIWDHLETYWPEIARLEKELTGLAPEKVEASPVMTKFGQLRGGYYPILFDRDLSYKVSAVQAEESVKDLFGGGFLRPMTKHGHVQERIGTGGKPLLLTLSPLVNHLSNVIHDLSFRRAVIDVNRLISDPQIREHIEGAVGKEMYSELRPWLVAVARERRGEYANAMEHIIARGRAGATVVHIGWRVTTALVHLPNYLAAVNQLGVTHAMRGLADVYAHTPSGIKRAHKFVIDNSPFMKERFQTFDRDIRDQMKMMNVEGADMGPMSMLTPFFNTRKIHASFFTLIHTAIMGGSLPTWHGGFRKAMDGHVEGIEGGNKEAAVDYADSLVREVWSAGSIKDLAPFQRGNETWRAFTMFYTFMSTVHNQMKKEGQQYRLYGNVGKLAAGAMLTWFLPAALSSLITGKAPSTDADPEEWAKWLAKTEAEWPLSTVLLLRDIAHPILEGHGDYYPSAAFDVPKEIVKAVQAMEKVATDEHDLTTKEWEDITDVAGYFLELPTRQLWLTLNAMYDYITGEKQVEDVPTDLFHSLVAQAEAPKKGVGKEDGKDGSNRTVLDSKAEPVFADLNRA